MYRSEEELGNLANKDTAERKRGGDTHFFGIVKTSRAQKQIEKMVVEAESTNLSTNSSIISLFSSSVAQLTTAIFTRRTVGRKRLWYYLSRKPLYLPENGRIGGTYLRANLYATRTRKPLGLSQTKESSPVGCLKPSISRTIRQKYRDREIVARRSKGPNPGFGRTPVKSTIWSHDGQKD